MMKDGERKMEKQTMTADGQETDGRESLTAEKKAKKYTHINKTEREVIERLLRNNTPKKQIAKILNRSIKTIRDEIKRGSVEQRLTIKTTKKDAAIPLYETRKIYFADIAQQNYEIKRKNCGAKCKLEKCKPYVEYVEKKMKEEKWSVDAAAGHAKRFGVFENTETVTTQTLYNWIDRCLLKTRNIDLPLKLKRKTHRTVVRQHKRLYGMSIDERPAEINKRVEFGHWEGDGIVGRNKKGFLISMVERVTRIGFLFNVGDKTSIRIVEVIDGLEKQFGSLFHDIFKSITFDNGTEFSDYRNISKNERLSVYYAHPYSSWERGTNENWNGIVRRFVPKGSSFDDLSVDTVMRIQDSINNMPRKIFSYKTPQEMFVQEVDRIIGENAVRAG